MYMYVICTCVVTCTCTSHIPFGDQNNSRFGDQKMNFDDQNNSYFGEQRYVLVTETTAVLGTKLQMDGHVHIYTIDKVHVYIHNYTFSIKITL